MTQYNQLHRQDSISIMSQNRMAPVIENSFPVQNVLFAMSDKPEALYITRSNLATASLEDGAPIKLSKGEGFSTNSYFNSFYPKYWRNYTDLNSLGVEILFRGKVAVKVIGVDQFENAQTIAFKMISASTKGSVSQTIWVLDLLEGTNQNDNIVRLYVEITGQENSSVFDLAYVTDKAPTNAISLSIGLCSFNREKELAVTVEKLSNFKSETPEIADVFVVNQGAEFLNSDLLSILEEADFHHIEQGNFGGCGGFNRSMIEAVSADNPATYHLLMDDDIDLDARVIKRALQFLGHTKKEMAIGGQMLDLFRQNILFEAGARVNRFWTVNSIGSGTDIAEPENLQVFNENMDIDYNAWWFCMIPTHALTKLDFSPPIFIHVDDIEYGCRMKKNGIRTLSLPGVGVWHEPFTYKKNDWILYYDLRNRLINSTAHPEISEQPDALFVFGFIMNFALIHRYRAARLASQAVRDFIKGPDTDIWLDSQKCHENLIAFLNSQKGPESLSNHAMLDFKEAQKIGMPDGTWEFVKQFVKSFIVLSLPNFRSPEALIVHGGTHTGAIMTATYLLASNENATEGKIFKLDRRRLWLTSLEALYLTLLYAVRHKSVSRKWKAKLPAMQTKEAWLRMFAKSDQR
jgi:galactofuranosylgalactofuranosylrhamnosyl-N-acetylglucosaminyl-diphospho-decaprenol beta-1,5/1,6-galactofuranosyltransferase